MSDFFDNSNFLYKYVSFNVFSLKMLIEGKLWFGEPKNLNDPNEGEFIIENVNELSEKNIINIKKELNPDIPPESFKYIYNGSGIRDFEREYFELMKTKLKSWFGIVSFSQKHENILLWTHYTGSHMGMCIVFDRELLYSSIKAELGEVEICAAKYVKEVPKIKIEFDQNDYPMIDGYHVLKHKNNCFKYEEEIRLIKYFSPGNNLDRFVKFDKTAIKAVIFGENMPNADRRTVAHILKSTVVYNNVRYFQSTKNFVTRNMRIEKLNGQSLIEVFKDFGVKHDFSGGIWTPKDFKY